MPSVDPRFPKCLNMDFTITKYKNNSCHASIIHFPSTLCVRNSEQLQSHWYCNKTVTLFGFGSPSHPPRFSEQSVAMYLLRILSTFWRSLLHHWPHLETQLYQCVLRESHGPLGLIAPWMWLTVPGTASELEVLAFFLEDDYYCSS